MTTTPARIGIITVSDRASTGIYADRSGPAIRATLEKIIATPWQAYACIIPDEQDVIEETLKDLCDTQGCCLVVTTGGTGPAPRDITPEATAAVCDKILDGLASRCVPCRSRSCRPPYSHARSQASAARASLSICPASQPPSMTVCTPYSPPYLTALT